MAQGPMDHDRISNVERALDEHKELTREQFREILRRMDAEQVKRDKEYSELQRQIDDKWNRSLERSDALHAEGRRRHDEAMARIDRKFDRLTLLILTSWLSTIATELYLHLRL